MFKLPKFFKKKKIEEQERTSKRQKLLLEKYNKGEVLVVDGETNNKEFFKSLELKDGPEEVTE